MAMTVVRVGADEDAVYVLPLADVDRARGWHVPALVVVDATGERAAELPALAQVVLLRRRLRAAGGDLVVAASPQVSAVLRSSGLHWAVPCHGDLTGAMDTLINQRVDNPRRPA